VDLLYELIDRVSACIVRWTITNGNLYISAKTHSILPFGFTVVYVVI